MSAILVADVVGYSLAMERDEGATLAALSQLRKTSITPLIDEHNGTIIKLMGDGFLVEFASIINAMNCALAWQDAVSNSDLEFRIGVNLGDVIVEDDDIYGNGVNVASRLEGLADPGGICVSASVYNEVKNRIEAEFEDIGAQAVKNIEEPVQAFRVRIHGGKKPQEPAPTKAETNAPAGPSIVVLPFDNMSTDDEQQYFSDGISEDLITDLSKIPSLFVIARNTAFAYRGKSTDLRKVAKELNVQHVLEGSVRKAGNRVRITAQLIDGETGGHIWAERYDRELQDIFALQDEITNKIVEALSLALVLTPERHEPLRQQVNPDAFDLVLRARKLMHEYTIEDNEEATRLYELAIEADPEYGMAYWGLAINLSIATTNGWLGDEGPHKALEVAQTGVRLAPNDPRARGALALCLLWLKDLDKALIEANRAVELAPSLAEAYATRGLTRCYNGDASIAADDINMAMRLEPHYPVIWLHFLAMARYLKGEFEFAAELLNKRITRTPNTDISRALLVSCYGQLGLRDEAKLVWQELKEVNPKYAAEDKINTLPYKKQQDKLLLIDGLHKAGVLPQD